MVTLPPSGTTLTPKELMEVCFLLLFSVQLRLFDRSSCCMWYFPCTSLTQLIIILYIPFKTCNVQVLHENFTLTSLVKENKLDSL